MNVPVHIPAHDDNGAGHGSAKSYLIGFVLAVLLTVIPFGLVMGHVLPSESVIPVVMGLGLVQIIVHLVFFLHMNTSSAQFWNNAAFVFALIILGILVAGSLWIMYHLNMNMMPGMMPSD